MALSIVPSQWPCLSCARIAISKYEQTISSGFVWYQLILRGELVLLTHLASCLPDLNAHGSNGLMTKSFRAAVALCGIHLMISTDYSPQIIVSALCLYFLCLLCPSTASLLMSHILRWSPKTATEIPGLCLAGWLAGSHTETDTFRQNS